jgi:hypothetical protein
MLLNLIHVEAQKNVGLVLSTNNKVVHLIRIDQAPIHDEYHCIATNRYDARSVRRIRELHERFGLNPSASHAVWTYNHWGH